MGVIRTVAAPVTTEIEKVKGSRFIADVAPATTEEAALTLVEEVRAREADASHHCWAFVMASGRTRSSDDGEPGGTAGAPIARHIGGSGLVDVVVVVTRYFGGTKLGMGGLVRAYGSAAAEGLSAVRVIERPVVTAFALTHDYELSGAVEGVLAGFDARTVESSYGAAVDLRVTVAEEHAEAFVAGMAEATSGRVEARPVPV